MVKRLASIVIVILLICSSCGNPCARPYKLRCKNIKKDLRCLYADYPLECQPLLLEEAIIIGLHNNWSLRFQKTQEQIQKELATSEVLKMLPHPRVNGELSQRSNLNLIFNTAPSSEKTTRTLETEALWNILELSLAFFNSRIAMMQVCSIKQQEIRAQHQLLFEITESYMNCLAHSNLLEEVEIARELIKKRIEDIDEEVEQKLMVASNALEEKNELEKKLLETLIVNTSFNTARQELLNKMGLSPDTPITLPKINLEEVIFPHVDIEELEEKALIYRPELAEQDVQEKIAKDEIKLSFARMIPGANFFISQDWDKNKYLVNPDWSTLGIRASYNLLTIPVNYFEARAGAKKLLMTRENRLYTSAAVLTQVNISALQSYSSWENYILAREKYQNRKEKLERYKIRGDTGVDKRSQYAYYYADFVLNKSIAFKGLSNYFTDLERLAVSVGIPLMFYEQTIKSQFSNDCEKGECKFD